MSINFVHRHVQREGHPKFDKNSHGPTETISRHAYDFVLSYYLQSLSLYLAFKLVMLFMFLNINLSQNWYKLLLLVQKTFREYNIYIYIIVLGSRINLSNFSWHMKKLFYNKHEINLCLELKRIK